MWRKKFRGMNMMRKGRGRGEELKRRRCRKKGAVVVIGGE